MKKTNRNILIIVTILLFGLFFINYKMDIYKDNMDNEIGKIDNIGDVKNNNNESNDNKIPDDDIDENTILIKVNKHEITFKEFFEVYNSHKTSYVSEFGEEALDDITTEGKTSKNMIKDNVTESLIQEKLKIDYLNQNNVEITEGDITNQINLVKDSFPNESEYKKYLANNSLSDDDLKDQAINTLIFQRCEEVIKEKYNIDSNKLKEIFENNKDDYKAANIRQIFVESEKEAEDILDKVAIDNFEKLAKKYSLESSSEYGGSMGYLSEKQMIEEFGKDMFYLQNGEISEVIGSNKGYHIIIVDDRKDTFEDLEADISHQVIDKHIQEILTKLKEDAIIEINKELLERIDN